MQVIRDLLQSNLDRETVLTIGAYDGLHLGHQELLQRLMRRAHETERYSAVVTFDPLPRAVLAPESNAVCLTSIEDKVRLLSEWGLDVLAILPFTEELARTSARGFVQMLHQHLHMTELWIGWDFALGYRREGDATALERLGRELGYQLHVIQPVRDGEAVISSTQIRHLLSEGRVAEAAEMLGRYHRLRGVVVPGKGVGRELGFPTANLRVDQGCAVPASGVYAVYATVGEERLPAAVNIGFAPTLGRNERSVEVHLLEFDGRELYGKVVLVEFVERLREERRFPDRQGLRTQIAKDVARARETLT